MTYEQITQKAAKALGFPFEKFILDFNQINLIEDGTGQAKSRKEVLREANEYIEYEYINCWYNLRDRPWKGVTFFMSKEFFTNLVSALNNVLLGFNEETIEIDHFNEKYLYLNEGSIVFSIYIIQESVELHFIKTNQSR
jgi:hypothetical protein